MLEEELPLFVNKPATECQLQKKRRKKLVLPQTKQIKDFHHWLETNRKKLTNSLRTKFSAKVWKDLASVCLTLIQVFNRKRAGEVERIKIEDFKTFHSIDSEEVGDLIQKEYLALNNEYVRFLIRGKRHGVCLCFYQGIWRNQYN